MPDTEYKCPRCGGKGFVLVSDYDTQACVCAHAKAVKAWLGPEIATSPTIKASPLFEPVKGEPPKKDETTENLFITSYWNDLLPHLKWALGCKKFYAPNYRFQIVTDEKLKTVFVGSEHYSQRSRSKRDDLETFNSLGDLVGEDFDLVIIRLGFLGYKNQAMPGLLKEALLIREAALKPTWLVERPDTPFMQGHKAYDEDVADYIEQRYDRISFQRAPKPVSAAVKKAVELHEEHAQAPMETVQEVSFDAPLEEDRPEPAAVAPEQVRYTAEFDLGITGGGGDDKYKKRKSQSWKKRGTGGGGPV